MVQLFANGGLDCASFCDPKANINGTINNWATKLDIKQAGPFAFAPIADNEGFFTRHQDKILVINGVNAQTNVHSAGRLTSLTGHNKNGYPSLCALHAAQHNTQLPMPLLVGNSFETGGIIAATQINGGLIEILKRPTQTDKKYLNAAQQQLIDNALNQGAAQSSAKAFYRAAIQGKQDYFAQTVDLYQSLSSDELPTKNTVVKDMKFALAAFAAGTSIACDYSISGFDTHTDHDKNMLVPLNTLTSAADAAWYFAEQLQIDRRLLVIISSEFGRTPFYNDVAGKDHWPFHSVIIMKKDATWSGRIVGQTDERLVGVPLNLNTLTADPNGTLLDMGHIQLALRHYLNISSTLDKKYPLGSTLLTSLLA
ncbi:MAG TPA: DUF1501 domain-containing protein [Cellvibrionaceae bacterium]|nr:DUF1501 domain-containing protein [Cellvibrionaceae bacterium]